MATLKLFASASYRSLRGRTECSLRAACLKPRSIASCAVRRGPKSLADDPRVEPKIGAAFAGWTPASSMLPDAPTLEQLYLVADLISKSAADGSDANFEGLPAIDGIERHDEVIRGMDGNEIDICIHRPKEQTKPLPCIVHIHGGLWFNPKMRTFSHWRDMIVSQGVVCVGVSYRRASGFGEKHPFPAALHDCAAGLEWLHSSRADLNLSKIVLHGEGLGGNLALAVALKAKREGKIDHIDGIYAMCPYLSNLYDAPPPDLPSLVENDGLGSSAKDHALAARLYTPDAADRRNPLAWPYWASKEDLTGLPPTVVSLNELDILTDEGLALYRKLKQADVPGYARTSHGTVHGTEVYYGFVSPESTAASVRDVAGFASSL